MGRTSTHQRLVQRRGGRKSMIGVVAIVMVLVPSVLVGSAQAKVPRNFFAIDDPFQTAPRAKDLRRMHRGHVGWVHIGLEWADVEPRRGEFSWKRPDQIIVPSRVG